ncbi:sorbosone dehydrogenase family protein [Luteolibacter flavescens]|uniref:Sorbosone dehydrogenase family protein n=1 Tax=Luteolibacter flavescens TaxID=1859460 RepID=A0ABT3FJT7_9BACT|nr:sorbosone dehydrogenase family protein [Luteolibacter flavescens]MCW1883801.1 sorbosone dehydrogenase family protein [Luteolibacter flavescens]
MMIPRFSALLSLLRRRQRPAPPRRFQRVRMFNFVFVGAAMLAIGISGDLKAEELRAVPFTPEQIKIDLDALPQPTPDDSPSKRPKIDPVPAEATLMAPEGFKVTLYASDMKQARWLALTPDGDVLLAQSREEKISILRDTDGDGSIDSTTTFADKSNGTNVPFGMAFVDGYFLLGNTDAVRRYPWKKGQIRLEGEGEQITELPGGGYNQHWTRNVIADEKGEWIYVSVGSESNVDVEKEPRATVLRMKPDGSARTVYGSGLRNPVGLALHPKTGVLFTTVNERDRLGDDLVPDYLTHVQEGGFYGWPYTYLKPENLDPRRVKDGKSENPELAAKTISPDLLFQAHSAALGICFSTGDKFPAKYRNGAFVAFRGSWNRNAGTGYKIVFVPFGADGKPTGHYEDFVKGFLTDESTPRTWGRPVDVMMHPDGSLLFTEEENGRVYRVSYEGG